MNCADIGLELHDFVTEDLAKHFPELIDLYNITVYDVAPTVLPMFDENLGKYAMQHFSREGINIKTSHRIQELRKGAPTADQGKWDAIDEQSCWTLKIQEEGEVGVGMVVWSTGLMNNPFVGEALGIEHKLASAGVKSLEMDSSTISEKSWVVKKDPKTGSIITDEHLRLALHPKSSKEKNEMVVLEVLTPVRLFEHQTDKTGRFRHRRLREYRWDHPSSYCTGCISES